jgi:hypothetical protein
MAPLLTITGVAGPRRPRVASTRPRPSQVIGRTPPQAVSTFSPTTSASTGFSPDGVAISVPGRKHSVLSSVSRVPVPVNGSTEALNASSV